MTNQYYGLVPSDFITTVTTAAARDTIPAQYEMPDEILHWQPPICSICKERKFCNITLPYGSDFDGEVICGDCCHKHFDPVIKEIIKKEE